jgi:hypothetical protein
VTSAKPFEISKRRVLEAYRHAGFGYSLCVIGRDSHTIGTRAAQPLPGQSEIQLALSSLPRHLRDNATVYTLNPARGFEVVRNGTNGFHAFVTRTGDDTFRGSWPFTAYRDDILYPISFDNVGARANMRIKELWCLPR